jgi:hypothetical protein
MNVTDVIRNCTQAVRDAIKSIDEHVSAITGQRVTSQERIKKSTTEITRQHALESERKKLVDAVSGKVAEAKRILDEIERKRQEALNTFLLCQEEMNGAESSLKDAQNATATALKEIRKEQKSQQEVETLLLKLNKEREEKQSELRRGLLEALEQYLKQQAEQVHAAFSTREQREKAMQEIEAFRKARHSDSEISRLCDQRDELNRFLNTSTVVGVKGMLQNSLKTIEEQIDKKFPGALKISETAVKDNPLEDLLFYCDRSNKAVFLLPVRPDDWDAAGKGETTESVNNTMCLVWNMIQELKLKKKDGDFINVRGHPAFASNFDLEEAAILEGFSVKSGDSEVIQYVLSPIPSELQEAINHED